MRVHKVAVSLVGMLAVTIALKGQEQSSKKIQQAQ
jgi:hypothetical protein